MIFRFCNIILLLLLTAVCSSQNEFENEFSDRLRNLCQISQDSRFREVPVKNLTDVAWDSLYIFYYDQNLKKTTWKNLAGLENYTEVDFRVAKKSKYNSNEYSVVAFVKDKKVIKTINLDVAEFKMIDPNFDERDFYIAGYHNHYFYPRSTVSFRLKKIKAHQCEINVKY